MGDIFAGMGEMAARLLLADEMVTEVGSVKRSVGDVGVDCFNLELRATAVNGKGGCVEDEHVRVWKVDHREVVWRVSCWNGVVEGGCVLRVRACAQAAGWRRGTQK